MGMAAAGLVDLAGMLLARGDLSKLAKPLSDAQRLELQGLVTRRRKRMAMELADDHRMKMSSVHQRCGPHTIIKALDRGIAGVDMDLRAFISANRAELAALLEGVKGVFRRAVAAHGHQVTVRGAGGT